jgi:hypothetical protein
MNVYGKTLPERLTEIVEDVGRPILEDMGIIQAQLASAAIVR